MVNFIYLAHTKERYIKQTVFSILSLLDCLRESSLEYQVVVYTDNSRHFDALPVQTVSITQELIAEWIRPIDYVHRAKLCLLIDAAQRFEGKLMTLDSDNCFVTDPTDFLESWNEDTVIMEKLEYRLEKPGDRVGKKYKRFFKRNAADRLFETEHQSYEVTMDQECWNSGVLGIQGAQRNFLNDALDVCDMLHRRFPKHISEQLATSIVMTSHFKVVDFRSYTYHWFGHGQAINNIIDEILFDYQQHDLETLMERVRSVRQRVVNAPLNRDKQPWYKRMFMPK